jgi:hypothetical protein
MASCTTLTDWLYMINFTATFTVTIYTLPTASSMSLLIASETVLVAAPYEVFLVAAPYEAFQVAAPYEVFLTSAL